MRPRLHPAVRYVACPDGVYLFGDRGARTLRGARAFDWLSRLEPYLNGAFELDELTAALPAEQRSTVEGMVTALHEHGFVTDAQDALPHQLSDADLRIYEREIAFLACAIDAPEHRFQRHREARVTVLGAAGTERVVSAVVAAGVRSGWAHVRVATAGPEAELMRAVDAARRDEHQRVSLTPDPELRDTDVVLQIADTTAELTSFAQRCPDHVALTQLLLGSEEAWITETSAPADTSCWKRLRANRKGATAPGPNRWLTGPVPAILAAHLVLGVFRHRTGLAALPAPTPGGPRVTRMDLRTLDMTVHRVTPISAVAEHDSRSPAPLGNQIASSPDELLTKAAMLVDEHTGVLSAFGEGDLPQFPLSLCRAVVSDPAAVIPSPAPLPAVTGWGPDQHTARTRTVLRALAVHAWLTAPAISAVDLVRGELIAPPVLSAHDRANPRATGVAAGLTRSDAIEWGLRQQCEALLAQRRAEWTARSPLADARTPLDDNGIRLLHQLGVVGGETTVLDLSDILGVPAYAVRTAHGHEVVSCATTAPDALRDGLERALLAWQGHPDTCAAAAGTSENPDLLAKALHESGFTAVAVELADELALVHCVRVVLDAA
ncbi:hypothetical protein [Nocardia brasiliensis]|uniref:hypothetical protein n=1 Tax=Nocardia brasiliensis TaxID=37326 RepID=UPI002453A66F|nr:hypothetical protein [Nocardia brasiliensis]